MKRNYVSPTAEKVTFNYSEQVVAASGACQQYHGLQSTTTTGCTDEQEWKDNAI